MVELADAVIYRSGRLIQWLRTAGWGVPTRSYLASWPPPPARFPAEATRRAASGTLVETAEELVFLGPLETRGGLGLFLDALTSVLTSLGDTPAALALKAVRRREIARA